MSNTIKVSGTQYETEDGILRTLIAWEFVGLSVDGFQELAKGWQEQARLGATPAERRFARAGLSAAIELIGRHVGTEDDATSTPIPVTYRGDLHDIMEAARNGLEAADDPEGWEWIEDTGGGRSDGRDGSIFQL